MISREAFVDIINGLREQTEQDNKNGDIITQLADPEFQYHKVIFTTPLIETIARALAKDCKLKKDDYIGDEISYFMWELDFGRNKMAVDCITRDDGSKVSLTTPEQLYDWIVETREEV